MSIQITRKEFEAAELRRKACQASDPDQTRRMLAIALILDGASRADAAKSAGMERQTLRDWVHRYNAEGIEGLKDRPNPGRKPLLNEEQLSELDRIVEKQPDPGADGVVRWRCRDLKAKIKNRFDVEISERSVAHIVDACCDPWNALMVAPDTIATLTRREWAKVSGLLAVGIRPQD